jgi:hypothetical protein
VDSKKALSGCARWKLKKAKARANKQELGAFSNQEMQAHSSRGNPYQNPQEAKVGGQYPYRNGQSSKKTQGLLGPVTYKETLTNIKIDIFRETYPEDKLIEDDQNCILEVPGRVLHGTPIGELPHLKSYRLEGGPLIYIYIYALTNSLVSG